MHRQKLSSFRMLTRSTQADTLWGQAHEKPATSPSQSLFQQKGYKLLQTGLHRIKAATSHRNWGPSPGWGPKIVIGRHLWKLHTNVFYKDVHLLGLGSISLPISKAFIMIKKTNPHCHSLQPSPCANTISKEVRLPPPTAAQISDPDSHMTRHIGSHLLLQAQDQPAVARTLPTKGASHASKYLS